MATPKRLSGAAEQVRARGVLGFRFRIVASVIVSALLLSACSLGPTHTANVDAADVESVDLRFYTYGAEAPPSSPSTHIDDRALVAELVKAFTDVPGGSLSVLPASTAGAQATDITFNLEDGSVSALTQIFISYQDVVLLWPDGTIQHTKWGAPLREFYRDSGTVITPSPSPS